MNGDVIDVRVHDTPEGCYAGMLAALRAAEQSGASVRLPPGEYNAGPFWQAIMDHAAEQLLEAERHRAEILRPGETRLDGPAPAVVQVIAYE